MTKNEHVYAICWRLDEDSDVISRGNIKTVEVYGALNFEAASVSSFWENQISHLRNA